MFCKCLIVPGKVKFLLCFRVVISRLPLHSPFSRRSVVNRPEDSNQCQTPNCFRIVHNIRLLLEISSSGFILTVFWSTLVPTKSAGSNPRINLTFGLIYRNFPSASISMTRSVEFRQANDNVLHFSNAPLHVYVL